MEKYYKMKKDYRFTFSRYEGQRLDEMIAKNIHTKSFCVWAYYNVENLDYAEDVLEELGLVAIDKKGGEVNPNLYKEWLDAQSEEDKSALNCKGRKVWLGNTSHWKKVNKAKALKDYYDYMRADSRQYTKGKLQSINQGH